MATYSIEEAKKLLSELIDKALAGEDVRIARDGEPVVQLRAASKTARRLSSQFVKEMAARAKLGRASASRPPTSFAGCRRSASSQFCPP
jgi:antitoxin (DNA-binding transcriptional repressor) of toxin-antitoxin stability system